jgi:predicted DsbA family dithiol-disulfide isomerase
MTKEDAVSPGKTSFLIEVWSDIVCPWCYIGKRRLEKALERLPDPDVVTVLWRSFELNPGAPRTSTETTRAMLARKYGVSLAEADGMQARVTALAAAEGLKYRLELTRPESSFDGHRLIHFAASQGLQGDLQGVMKERLFSAYFTEGVSLGDREALIRLAEEAGLDGREAGKALEEGSFADAVRADEERAVRLGIRGVPFFVIAGKYGISGAQPVEVMLEAMEKGLREMTGDE